MNLLHGAVFPSEGISCSTDKVVSSTYLS